MKKLFKVLLVHSSLLSIINVFATGLMLGNPTKSPVKPVFMAIWAFAIAFSLLFPYVSILYNFERDWSMKKLLGIGLLPALASGMILIIAGGFELSLSPGLPAGVIVFTGLCTVNAYLLREDSDFWEVNIPYVMIAVFIFWFIPGIFGLSITGVPDSIVQYRRPGGDYNTCLSTVETRCTTVGGVFEKPESCERAEGMDERIREMGYSVNSSHISCNG